MSTCNVRLALAALLLAIGVHANAAIVIAPGTPASGQAVTLSLVVQYTSAASVTSASIVRNGRTFVIEQTVDITCMLPSAPILTSTFDVGPLMPGNYDVVANITRTTSLPGCIVSDETQSAAFEVSGTPDGGVGAPQVVPSSGLAAGIALLLAIGTFGLFGLRHRD